MKRTKVVAKSNPVLFHPREPTLFISNRNKTQSNKKKSSISENKTLINELKTDSSSFDDGIDHLISAMNSPTQNIGFLPILTDNNDISSHTVTFIENNENEGNSDHHNHRLAAFDNLSNTLTKENVLMNIEATNLIETLVSKAKAYMDIHHPATSHKYHHRSDVYDSDHVYNDFNEDYDTYSDEDINIIESQENITEKRSNILNKINLFSKFYEIIMDDIRALHVTFEKQKLHLKQAELDNSRFAEDMEAKYNELLTILDKKNTEWENRKSKYEFDLRMLREQVYLNYMSLFTDS